MIIVKIVRIAVLMLGLSVLSAGYAAAATRTREVCTYKLVRVPREPRVFVRRGVTYTINLPDRLTRERVCETLEIEVPDRPEVTRPDVSDVRDTSLEIRESVRQYAQELRDAARDARPERPEVDR